MRNDLKPIGNRMGYERACHYEGEYSIITGIGTNGFIVSAYPAGSTRRRKKADKPRMLGLPGKLNARIAELNDGSFAVDDQEMPRIEAL